MARPKAWVLATSLFAAVVILFALFQASPEIKEQLPSIFDNVRVPRVLLEGHGHDTNVIHLRSGPLKVKGLKHQFSLVDTGRVVVTPTDVLSADSQSYLVHLRKSADLKRVRLTLERKSSVIVTTYIPENTFLVHAPVWAAQAIAKMEEVDWVGVYRPEFKLSPQLTVNDTLLKINAVPMMNSHHAHAKEDTAPPSIASIRVVDAPEVEEQDRALLRLFEERNSHRTAAKLESFGLLDVLIDAGLRYSASDMQLLADRYTKELQDLGYPVTVTPTSPLKLRVYRDEHASVLRMEVMDVQAIAHLLANQKEIHWIEPVSMIETATKYARWTTHGIDPESAPAYKGVCSETCKAAMFRKTCTEVCNTPACAYDGGDCLPEGASPISILGLDGQNEIVSVADTGLDVFNCYFYDDKHAVPLALDPINKVVNESAHRKVWAYWPFIDDMDDSVVGHGTLVSSSIAGRTVSNLWADSNYNGVAHNAKIFMADMGCSKPGGCGCTGSYCPCRFYPNGKCPESAHNIYLPTSVYSHYILPIYKQGARIHASAMAGSSKAGYDLFASELDQAAYQHPDFLMIFPSGNEGRDKSISNFGHTKNGITVGATHAGKESERDSSIFHNDERDRLGVELLRSIEKTYCSPTSKKYDKTRCDVYMSLSSSKVCCAYEAELRQSGASCDLIQASIGSLCCVDGCLKEIVSRDVETWNLAEFSSAGPTLDGRVKPDLVAPGQYIVGARSHGSDQAAKCRDDSPVCVSEAVIDTVSGTVHTPRTDSQKARGNAFKVDRSHVLEEIEFKADIVRDTEVQFFVYRSRDGSAFEQVYDRRFIAKPNVPGTFVTSGSEIDITLHSGEVYFIGMAWNGTLTYYQNSGYTNLQSGLCFGHRLGGRGVGFYPLNFDLDFSNAPMMRDFPVRLRLRPAYTDQSLKRHEGTSLSAAAIAANAALVRQYYRKGFYPSGLPNDKDSFVPSAALIKATLINSADELAQAGIRGKIISAYEKKRALQGFGSISLDSGLALQESMMDVSMALPGHSTRWGDPSIDHGQVHEYCIQVLESTNLPLKVTLVWTDPPSSPLAGAHLINDLDLSVESPKGKSYLGNNDEDTMLHSSDRRNNVEKVVVSKPDRGVWRLAISGTKVPYGPQAYAVVATGKVALLPECPRVALPFPPAGYIPPCQGETSLSALGGFVGDGSRGVYENDVSCRWVIKPENAANITLNFIFFDLEDSPYCLKDYVAIYDGLGPTAHLLGKFCGSNIPPSITSPSDTMVVEFRTDADIQGRGFGSVYAGFVPICPYGEAWDAHSKLCVAPRTFKKCEKEQKLTAGGGYVEGGNEEGPNEKLQSCKWLIAPDNAAAVKLQFVAFELLPDPFCENHVAVYEASMDAKGGRKLLGKVCGNDLAHDFVSTTGAMIVEFSNKGASTSSGFSAVYSSTIPVCGFGSQWDPILRICVPATTYKQCFPEYTTTAQGGLLEGDRHCRWTIRPHVAQAVSLEFKSFSLPEDPMCQSHYVAVYDGEGENATLAAKYCGGSMPPVTTTAGPVMTIELVTSELAGVVTGISAHYHAIVPKCGPQQVWSQRKRACLSVNRECHLLQWPGLCQNIKFTDMVLPKDVQVVECQLRTRPALLKPDVIMTECSDPEDLDQACNHPDGRRAEASSDNAATVAPSSTSTMPVILPAGLGLLAILLVMNLRGRNN